MLVSVTCLGHVSTLRSTGRTQEEAGLPTDVPPYNVIRLIGLIMEIIGITWSLKKIYLMCVWG